MIDSILAFNERIERLIEVALVLSIGAMLSLDDVPSEVWWFLPLLFLVIRPLAVFGGLLGQRVSFGHRAQISWLGIRGIGSVYYLMHAIGSGLPDAFSRSLVALIIVTIATSIFLHGITASFAVKTNRQQR
jgi:NhaP-type Na+/H+ or K+/H+ antiporter